jgi:beta-lactamase regulating signal transducer with metallopeptidase domain/ankyrin repeat protein
MSDWLADSLWGGLLNWVLYDGAAAAGNHLWQSTLFALLGAALVLLLRGNSARVRHLVWMAVSLKFLLPFAALALLGAQLPWRPGAEVHPPQIISMAAEVAAPAEPVADHWELMVPEPGKVASATLFRYDSLLMIFGGLWLLGTLAVAMRWLLRWRAIRRIVRKATPAADVDFPAPVRITTEAVEPGIVGIVKPVLLLPAGIHEHLSAGQMHAVLAHERCHLRRRDNFTATLHMLVETLFWFHPMVWWISARLIDERERACDEQVLREGHASRVYGEAILRVCEHYIVSRLPCVSGVSGSDLRKRIESITSGRLIAALGASRKAVLVGLACLAVATPIAAGVASWRSLQGRSAYRSAAAQYWSVTSARSDMTAICGGRNSLLLERQQRLRKTVALLQASDGKRVLLHAVLANSPADVRRLLAGGAALRGDGFLLEDSPMHVAARFGDPELLQALHAGGIPLDGMTDRSNGGIAGAGGYSPLMAAISAGNWDNADWLITNGADVNAAGPTGISALRHAMVCRNEALTMKLVRAGAQPTEADLRTATNLGFSLTPVAAAGVAAPAGWKSVDPAILQAQRMRAESPSLFAEARADFDGDGMPDDARLLVATDGSREALFVRRSSRAVHEQEWQVAATISHTRPADDLLMGISVQAPGSYVPACAKGFGRACQPGEPAEVVLEQPGISLFQFEGAASLVYWDRQSRRFNRVWISD